MRRVLIVDDSNILRHLIKVYLAGMKRDFEVTAVHNGREALDHIVLNGPPSLVLLDVNMPVMNGLQFLGELTKLGLKEKTPVIIVSTEGKEEDVLRGLQAGAQGYLRKPFTQIELQKIVDRVIGP